MLELLMGAPKKPSAGWVALGNAPTRTFYASAVGFENKLYIYGGYAYNGPAFTSGTVHESTDGGNTWSLFTTIETRAIHGSVVLGNKMFTCGGHPNPHLGGTMYLRRLTALDLLTKEFSVMAPPPKDSKAYGFFVKVNGKGWDFAADSSLQAYDPETNSWTSHSTGGVIPAGLNQAAAVAIGSKLYIFAGANGSTNLNSLYVYDTVNETCELVVTTNTPSVRRAAKIVEISGKLYAWGGYTDGVGYSVGFYEYTPETKQWVSVDTKNNVVTRLGSIAVLSLDNSIYMFGTGSDLASYGGSAPASLKYTP